MSDDDLIVRHAEHILSRLDRLNTREVDLALLTTMGGEQEHCRALTEDALDTRAALAYPLTGDERQGRRRFGPPVSGAMCLLLAGDKLRGGEDRSVARWPSRRHRRRPWWSLLGSTAVAPHPDR